MQLSLPGLALIEQAKQLAQQLDLLPEAEAVEVLNQVRLVLHEHSPFKQHPVDCIQWVPSDQVEGNAYNPNKMAPPERRYLEKSILDNGYAMPVVVIDEEEEETSGELDGKAAQDARRVKRIVDGFHKSEIGKTSKAVRRQTKGYLPIAYIRPGRWALTDRMAATIQFNVHGEASIQGLSDMVLKLSRKGWSNEKIAEEMGKEPDLVVRLLQNVGLAEVWKDSDFRQAWEMVELLSLERALSTPVVDLVVCAEWEEKTFVVKQRVPGLYRLSIDDEEIWASNEKMDFASANEIEGAIQKHIPSYQVGAELWYDALDDWDDDGSRETAPLLMN